MSHADEQAKPRCANKKTVRLNDEAKSHARSEAAERKALQKTLKGLNEELRVLSLNADETLSSFRAFRNT